MGARRSAGWEPRQIAAVRVRRHWLAISLFGGVLVVAGATAYSLHSANRERAIAQFEDHELHTADEISAMLRSQLAGAALAMRTLSATLAHQSDRRVGRGLLDQPPGCPDLPCISAVALFGRDGEIERSSARVPHLKPDQVRASLQADQDRPGHSRLLTATNTSGQPVLLLLAPTFAPTGGPAGDSAPAGLLAAEIEFDSLFTDLQRAVDAEWPSDPVLVLDGQGTVMFLTKHPEMRMRNVRHPEPGCRACHVSFDYVERMQDMKHGVLRYEKHGVPHLGAVSSFQFEGTTWTTHVLAPQATAVDSLASEVRELGLVLLATFLACGTGLYLTWRDGRQRIRADAQAARKADLERSHQELTALNAHLESALKEWRLTVDTLDAAVLLLEPAGTIQRMNRVAADMLPGAPFGWVGQPTERLSAIPPWDSALTLARGAAEHKSVSAARVVYTVTGQTWDVWCRTLTTAEGRELVIAVVRDVTSVVELQESLRRSEKAATLGSVVLGVAHEVRNPLFAISSLVEALSVQKGRDPRAFLDALRREVIRLQTLMVELLEYGRPVTSTLRPHGLAPVIDGAISACSSQAEARQVRLLARWRAKADAWIDEQRLTRVFVNLIQNAVQHAPQGTDVTIDVDVPSRGNASQLEVVVRDHGPGFAAEDLPHVFTPFFSRRAGGFGLGLAITERIVNEHRGHVAATNHPEGGAMVKVTLPLTKPEGTVDALEGAQPC